MAGPVGGAGGRAGRSGRAVMAGRSDRWAGCRAVARTSEDGRSLDGRLNRRHQQGILSKETFKNSMNSCLYVAVLRKCLVICECTNKKKLFVLVANMRCQCTAMAHRADPQTHRGAGEP